MPKRRLTPNRAAAETRSKILRELKRLQLEDYPAEAILEQLRIFILNMARRASARPGGLGRR